MYIFNTTFSVNGSRINEWKEWINKIYLPGIGSMMITHGIEIFEVLGVNDDEHRTFSVQWRCHIHDHLDQITHQSTHLLSTLKTQFGEDCLYFSSVLQEFPLD